MTAMASSGNPVQPASPTEPLRPSASPGAGWPAWVFYAAVLLSAGFFALSSAWAKDAIRLNVTPLAVTFWRFSIGWALALIYVLVTRSRLSPRNYPSLILRGVFNAAAVLLLYWSVKYTTIAKANLLNLTYPVFVALLGGALLGERLRRWDWPVLAAAMVGIYIIIDPQPTGVNWGDVLGLACGITSALAILMLRSARQGNSTITVLFFLLTVGLVLTAPLMLRENIAAYTAGTWWAVLACATTGVLGQFALTLAFRHMTAFAGSLVGMVRVIISTGLGLWWFDEHLSPQTIVGAGILLGALAAFGRQQSRKGNGGAPAQPECGGREE